jgi:protoporphyrin/coproporphyrin ferrochelatase
MPRQDDRSAVVLLNLGGPDSLDAVRPFLYNLFSDPDIFKLPFARLTQKPFAALVSRRRAPEAAKGYAAIGGRSPLLENTRAQARALEQALRRDDVVDVHVCMRYWHPMAPEVVADLKRRQYARVLLLPLYPQYSRTTTGSSVNAFEHECRRQDYRPKLSLVQQWYDEPAYQEAIVETLKTELARFPEPRPDRVELLLSAHGLPRKIVDAGDPYERQIVATASGVGARLGWPHITLCYQSRVGPLEWLKPYTDEIIRAKADAGAKQVLVYPIAFVSDHVETLYELGIVYADLARACGIPQYRVAPALNAHPGLIDALRACVARAWD